MLTFETASQQGTEAILEKLTVSVIFPLNMIWRRETQPAKSKSFFSTVPPLLSRRSQGLDPRRPAHQQRRYSRLGHRCSIGRRGGQTDELHPDIPPLAWRCGLVLRFQRYLQTCLRLVNDLKMRVQVCWFFYLIFFTFLSRVWYDTCCMKYDDIDFDWFDSLIARSEVIYRVIHWVWRFSVRAKFAIYNLREQELPCGLIVVATWVKESWWRSGIWNGAGRHPSFHMKWVHC